MDIYIPCTHCVAQQCKSCDYKKLKEDRQVPAVLCNNDQCQCNGKGYCECDEIEIVEGMCCFYNK